ncbi:hypothetical protein NUW58_g900 [Xylaria curta]|uniref:Uncharacterized protein n=1 Tax=Xylaria curta TaxID=42375 RepID=A0ACC1PN11_9PEZI|nr:hypothetical protein NUW58_g900 [Xylaria curta]
MTSDGLLEKASVVADTIPSELDSKNCQPSDICTTNLIMGSEEKFTENHCSTAPDNENSKKEDKKKPDTQESWQSVALLYCSKNGRPHSVLIDFGHRKCPLCKEHLGKPEVIDRAAEARKQGTESGAKDSGDADNRPLISYAVEYADNGNNTITREPRKEPFDLQAERRGIEKKGSVFEVVTVLKTTIPSQSRRSIWEVERIMERGILKNPAIDTTISDGKMRITSPDLIKAINAVVDYYPSVSLEGDAIEIMEPYPLIAHHLDQLEKYSKRYQNGEVEKSTDRVGDSQAAMGLDTRVEYSQNTSPHIDLLLNYIKKSVYKNRLRDELVRYGRMACTFPMLWLLFKPGDTVYCETQGYLAAYVVSHVNMDSAIFSEPAKKSPYEIWMWGLDFDGEFVGRCTKTVTIPPFDGERAITSLKVFPCQYIDKHDNGQTREKLEGYGQEWYKHLVGQQVYYSGKLLDSGNAEYRGRAYADSKSYYSQYPESTPKIGEIEDMGEGLPKCSCTDCKGRRAHPPDGFRWADYDALDPSKNKDLETNGSEESAKHRYLLCNRRLWGLILKTRTWASLDVANCSTPRANSRPIENLVMPEERKTMIKALVDRFTDGSARPGASKPWQADHMDNKGEGQIFLLHGGPGVGKTFDKEVEANLTKWFKLAETWGAVMLIDEADVYLERRQLTDLKRNSLVSGLVTSVPIVFLRSVEYYRGILFLTTNRVGTFDDAFVSRIHVVIAYENLGKNERARIWKQFFNKLSEDRQDMTITSRAKRYVLEDENVVDLDWNGREIRNAFQTAVALAEYRFQEKKNKTEDDQPVLDQGDFEQVLDMTSQFKKTLVIDDEQLQAPIHDDELLFPLDLKDVQVARSGGCMFICKLIEFPLWSFEFDQISTDWRGKENQLQLYTRVGRSGESRFLDTFRGIGFRNKVDLEEVSWWNTSFRVFTTADNPAQSYVTTRPINEHPGSEENIGGMRRFLQACLNGQPPHTHCTEPSDVYTPTRLLFIECRAPGGEAPKVRLCYPNGKSPYAALSYCWGGDQLHKTTRTNVNSRSSGISWDEIPQTIKDAIRVAIGVGLSYLWVDSFCIIQDDEQGKLREIAQMPRIYRHATVTIVASRSKGASEGFLHDINPAELTAFTCEVPYRCPTGDLGTVYLVEDGKGRSMSEPIDDRGWTLQESYLSGRLMTFESRQSSIICQCSPERPSFSDGWRQKSRQQPMQEVTFAVHAGNRRAAPSKNGMRECRDINGALLAEWQSCLFDYTKRKLTEPTDRCLAISGLAEVIAPGLGGGYLAGLWGTFFAVGVALEHWRVDGTSTTAKSLPRAFLVMDFGCHVELSDPLAQFGAVKYGQLCVKGRLVRAEWTTDGLMTASVGGRPGTMLVPQANEILFYSPDTRDVGNLSSNLGALEEHYEVQESLGLLSADKCASITNVSVLAPDNVTEFAAPYTFNLGVRITATQDSHSAVSLSRSLGIEVAPQQVPLSTMGDVAVQEVPLRWRISPPPEVRQQRLFTVVTRIEGKVEPLILEAFVLNEPNGVGDRIIGHGLHTGPGFDNDGTTGTYIWFNIRAMDQGVYEIKFRLAWRHGSRLYGGLETANIIVNGRVPPLAYCTDDQDLLALLEPDLYDATPIELMGQNASN